MSEASPKPILVCSKVGKSFAGLTDLDVAENIFMSGAGHPTSDAAPEGTPEGADVVVPRENRGLREYTQTPRPRRRAPRWFIDWRSMYGQADALLAQLGVKLDPK